MTKLTSAAVHLVRLARKNPDSDGWVKVSKQVWPFVEKEIPADLRELRPGPNGGGHVRLTERGHAIADYA